MCSAASVRRVWLEREQKRASERARARERESDRERERERATERERERACRRPGRMSLYQEPESIYRERVVLAFGNRLRALGL